MPWAPVSDLSGIDLALPLLSHREETWVILDLSEPQSSGWRLTSHSLPEQVLLEWIVLVVTPALGFPMMAGPTPLLGNLAACRGHLICGS